MAEKLTIKQAVENILHETYETGSGGFASDFNLATLNTLREFTGFDLGKRRCLKDKNTNVDSKGFQEWQKLHEVTRKSENSYEQGGLRYVRSHFLDQYVESKIGNSNN